MSGKVYQIVDPETGEVVAEKRMGKLQLEYYKALSGGKIALALFRMATACFFLTVASMIVFLLLPDGQKWKAALPFAVLSVSMYILAVVCLHTPHKRDDKESDNEDGK